MAQCLAMHTPLCPGEGGKALPLPQRCTLLAYEEATIEEEKYIVTDTFLSYGLHMTRSKSDEHFVCCVCCVCCSKLVVNRNWWCGAGQMLTSLLDGSSCVP